MAQVNSLFGEVIKVNATDILTDTGYLWGAEYRENARPHHDIICDYLQGKVTGKVLDIAERNPLTVRLEGRNGVNIDSTAGDLDICFVPGNTRTMYDTIIMSHVIEHLFNPLACLMSAKDYLKAEGKMYIIAPVKPYWITPAKCHFHEMDMQRMQQLITRAGLFVSDWYEYSVPIEFKFSVRNWLRRLYNEYAIITVTK